MADEPVKRGDRVRYRDANGVWREGWATSEIEYPGFDYWNPKGQKRRHNFTGVYVSRQEAPKDGGMFWPIDDVEPAADTAASVGPDEGEA